MSHQSRMPPVPPANRSPKGTESNPEGARGAIHEKPVDNAAEQGETGNIRQNTINAGYFHGRRVK